MIKPEDVKLIPAARKEKAKLLVDGGLSRRKTAKALGVSHAQINKDVGNKVSKNGNKVSTKASKTRTAHEEIAKFTFNQPAKDVPAGDSIRFGDFFILSGELKSNTVDLVFTDPPYDDESLPLYEQLGEVAARVLKPGGSLITYCGHMQLLKAGEAPCVDGGTASGTDCSRPLHAVASWPRAASRSISSRSFKALAPPASGRAI